MPDSFPSRTKAQLLRSVLGNRCADAGGAGAGERSAQNYLEETWNGLTQVLKKARILL